MLVHTIRFSSPDIATLASEFLSEVPYRRKRHAPPKNTNRSTKKDVKMQSTDSSCMGGGEEGEGDESLGYAEEKFT